MKILHVISGGDTGGAKTHVINLLKELQKRIEVDLVCFMEGVFSKEARFNHISIEVIPQKNRLDLSAIKKLVKKINHEKYDIIHCHGARANFVSIPLKFFCQVPIVTTIHSDYRLDFQGDFFKNIIFTNTNAVALRFMDYYIGVSNNFKKMMIERGFPKNRVYAVYNGIAFDQEIHYIEKNDFYKKHRIPYTGKEIFVGIMGRLDPVKGHTIFLEAAARAYHQNHNLRFLIAGNGEEEKKLKDYAKKLEIADVTYFLGFIDHPYDFFNAVDINTLTSYSESFPYVILEGAMLKKPTISSKVGGIEDILFDGDTGYIFEKEDYDTLSKRILELAVEKEQRLKLGENLYSFVKNHFSTKHMADQHIHIYQEIIKKKVD